jgi:hypothetical protein
VLTILAGMALLFCTGLIGVAFLAYQKAAAPDRSSPEVAANNYLIALLNDRNPTRARLFSCADQSRLANLQQFERDIENRERELDAAISVKIENLLVQRTDDTSATGSVDLRRVVTTDGTRQSLVDHWRLELVDEDGWRVCGGSAG